MTSLAASYECGNWTQAISAQPWGVQQAIKTSLELVRDGDVKMCWGRDYDGSNNAPCLINSINMMLSANADKGPSQEYPHVVGTFDELNRYLYRKGVNTGTLVDPLAAEIMLKHMGQLAPVPENAPILPTADEVAEWLSDPKNLEASPAAQEILEEIMRSD